MCIVSVAPLMQITHWGFVVQLHTFGAINYSVRLPLMQINTIVQLLFQLIHLQCFPVRC